MTDAVVDGASELHLESFFRAESADRVAQTENPLSNIQGLNRAQDGPAHGETSEAPDLVVVAGARLRADEVRDAVDLEAIQEVGEPVWPVFPAQGPFDVCIISHSMPPMRHYAEHARANHAAYASRHGYAYAHYEGVLDSRRFRDTAEKDVFRRFGFYWQSFAAIEDAMAHRLADGTRLCREVMWVDADVVFTRFDLSVDALLGAHGVDPAALAAGELAAVASRQEWHHHTHLNAGVFLVHNGELGEQFVDEVIGRFASHKDVRCPEQTAMEDYAFATDASTRQDRVRRSWEEASPRLRADFIALPQRAMNSFHGYPIGDTDSVGMQHYAWHDGDFAAHFTGPKSPTQNADRLATLRSLAERRQ